VQFTVKRVRGVLYPTLMMSDTQSTTVQPNEDTGEADHVDAQETETVDTGYPSNKKHACYIAKYVLTVISLRWGLSVPRVRLSVWVYLALLVRSWQALPHQLPVLALLPVGRVRFCK
jgi:hypothetical protein